MFPKTGQKRRKTILVALTKTWDLAGDGFLIVPDGPVSAGSRKCAAPPHLSGHRASEKYLHNTLHKQRIAVQASNNSCMLQEKYISSQGKLAKVKLTQYDVECYVKVRPLHRPRTQDARTECCSATRRQVSPPGPWFWLPSHHRPSSPIQYHHRAPNCPAHALPQLKMKRR